MSMASIHDDWLSLIDISGPFLAVPVLKDAFPQGLEELDAAKRKRLRQAYDEWREALEQEDPQFNKLHFAWIEEVLSRGLEFDEDGKGDVLKGTDWCAANLNTFLPDHGVALSPHLAIVDEQCANKPLMLIHTYAQNIDLDATLKIDGWAATPTERMVQLCRSKECRLGLVTNGERWMLVDAPVGAVTSFASWYARLWNQEPITLQAFVHLLGIRRFFVDESEQLPALFDSSLKYQDEVTDALGEQVRRAVEVLIQSLDKADQDRNRELLYNVKESELYEAALTVMMRLVFLLSAEERGLLLLGDERYEANYALSTLRMQLRKMPKEILERRWDAWSRLLAIFRAVFCGVEHESLRLPALGSSLFDPDHFPFLEGRAKGSSWRTDTARPLPIDNRTVLLLLEAIQQFQGRTLSYRALDVEQIGYVYEGLLERTVRRTDEVTLELTATNKSQYPWVTLAEIDVANTDGTEQLVKLLQERSGSSASRVRKELGKAVDDTLSDRLLTICQGDTHLRDRIKPYAHLLRTDPWEYPLVYPVGAFIVTSGSNRHETGTHYTPKSLTEAIVAETLTPVAYIGLAEGMPREAWQLKSPAELLDLKICDPAMGSGAFLVQVCRWLGDRLVEAWSQAEVAGNIVSVDGDVQEELGTKEPLPRDTDARIIIARRLIAERCLYGVDLNPLAVELAKLSIWLVTLAKGLPFGFLDHSLRCGNSLLGIHQLEQLTELDMAPSGKVQQQLFGSNITNAVHEAIELRQRLRGMPIRDIQDVEAMAKLDIESRCRLEVPELIADALLAEVLNSVGRPSKQEKSLSGIATIAAQAVEGDPLAIERLRRSSADNGISMDNALFHWAITFPEVLSGEQRGFDAIVSNPPWGAALSSKLQALWKKLDGQKLERLVDSFHLFVIRSCQLLRRDRPAFAGLLVPDVLLYQGYSQPLREYLIEECHISNVCNIGDGAFTRVTRPCCYIVFSRLKNSATDISISKWKTQKSTVGKTSFMLPSDSLKIFPGCIIPTNNLPEYFEIAHLVSALPYKLSDLVDEYGIQRGASADNKDVFVVSEELAIREDLENEYLKPVVTGGIHLKPFLVSDNLPRLIYTNRDVSEKKIPNIIDWVMRNASKITCKEVQQGKHPIHVLHRPRDIGLFERRVKLLGVITSDRPKVAVDTRSLYAMDGTFVLAPRDDVDPYYLAGVLNSKMMARIYRVFSQEEGRVMAQVKPTIVAELPIVSPNSESATLQKLVAKISFLSKRLHSSELDEGLRDSLIRELDEIVEELFSQACVLDSCINGSSTADWGK